MKKTIIITGGCGFIGTNVALAAKEKGYHVVVFDSLIRPNTEENLAILHKKKTEIIKGDIRNTADLERLPKQAVGIIHLAANPGIPWSITWPEYDFETNARGTFNILQYAHKHGSIPVIYGSTNKIYSEETNLIPIKETSFRYEWDFEKVKKKYIRSAVREGISQNGVSEDFPMDSSGRFPHSPYGVSKAAGDLYCQEYFHIFKLPVVVNRMSCIYGLYQKGVEDQGWVDWFVRAKLTNQPINIYGTGKQVRDVLFGNDLAELYLLELENIKKIQGQVFNVGGGVNNTASLLEVIYYLNEKTQKKFKIQYHPPRLADQKVYISDIRKVTKMIGWKPVITIYEGIEKMYKFYENQWQILG